MRKGTGRLLGSVRVRTTLAASVIVGLVLLAGSFAMVALLERSVMRGVQDALRSRVADVSSIAATRAIHSPLTFAGDRGAVVQVVDPPGQILAATRQLHDD